MSDPTAEADRSHDETLLRALVEGTASETGEAFFRALVRNVARALGVAGAWITELTADGERLRALAFWLDDGYVEGYEYALPGTPCEAVVEEPRELLVADRVVELYPGDPDLADLGAVSYASVPLATDDGEVLGNLAVLDTRPMKREPRGMAVLRIFAQRATAELLRLRAEADVRRREEKLTRLLDSAMDAILELDGEFRVTRANPSAEKLFRAPATRLVGGGIDRLFVAESRARLRSLAAELGGRPEGRRHLWVAGGLTALRRDGDEFRAEATLSRFDVDDRPFLTLILRDVNDRLEAEATIRRLASRAAMLEEDLAELQGDDAILGHSDALRRALRQVKRVAPTDATVLLTGETGTGKELFARAIHAASPRADAALVRVNCAAVPASLMESEFFGHERGAFTGATRSREGRFELADGGTIFLDEVGELSLDLQAKLLRVLQEGTFEPVGSSLTRDVDVRVVAATNRDLATEVEEGRFREDLFYRLAVFPLELPPLRDRGNDVVLLARAFAETSARRHGREPPVLDETDEQALRAYRWPGNVRELQNVVERAVITAVDGRLELARFLPPAAGAADTTGDGIASAPSPSARVLREEEMRRFERENLLRALEASGWKVSGEGGAAERVGLPPSTLRSRMKAFGLERPATG
jgi:PAS domain S-box-containing protein